MGVFHLSPFYKVERNDYCPCGSGNKYKKCCLPRVEKANRLINQALGPGTYTAYGRQITNVLSFLCGLNFGEGGKEPDPFTLGKLLAEAWDQEEKEEQRAALFSLWYDLLSQKAYLRRVRIPVHLLPLDDEEDQGKGERGRIFLTPYKMEQVIYNALENMALSLRYDHYTDDELKAFLMALGWAVLPDTQEGFCLLLFKKSVEDLSKAREEIDKLREKEELDQEEFFSRLEEIIEHYPVYQELISLYIQRNLKPALEALQDGRLKLNVPFYCVISGIYYYLDRVSDFLLRLPAEGKGKNQIKLDFVKGDLIKEQMKYFLPELFNYLKHKLEENPEDEINEFLETLLSGIMWTDPAFRLSLIHNLYTRCIYNFLNSSAPIEGVNLTIKTLLDLLDSQLINAYSSYLRTQDKEEEARYVEEQYERWLPKLKPKMESLMSQIGQMQEIIYRRSRA